jgi:hypothetical protein
MQAMRSGCRRGLLALALAFSAAPALAGSDSCREWEEEHDRWKAETVRRYLTGASPRELDEALFELLQREAYLTSCEVPVDRGRATQVGWRLVGRTPDEYASAVLESLLARSGLDVGLNGLFDEAAPPPLAGRRWR